MLILKTEKQKILKSISRYIIILITFQLTGCKKDDIAETEFFSNFDHRTFSMGFTTWPYARTTGAVDSTYLFISKNADIYSEHLDYRIPWNAWMNDLPLPDEFTDNIRSRANRKIPGKKLLLSVSLLNTARNDLALDYDDTRPDYVHMNDKDIEDAYFKHINYLVENMKPDYLVIAVEINGLMTTGDDKWEEYKSLIGNIKTRIRQEYPELKISESVMLHVMLGIEKTHPQLLAELFSYINQMDFASVSYYPFADDYHTKAEFQTAFDLINQNIKVPVAFVETAQIAQDLIVPALNVNIKGNEAEQQLYLETLCTNAQENNYEFIIWWGHRDYTALWQTLPGYIKDLAKLWLNTGILRDDGSPRAAYQTWQQVYKKQTVK